MAEVATSARTAHERVSQSHARARRGAHARARARQRVSSLHIPTAYLKPLNDLT
jgi:hypothetical protein